MTGSRTRRLHDRLRACDGQVSAEYVGLILIVAAIIGAIAVTSIGSTISEDIRAAICQIGGGDCETDDTAAVPQRCLQSSTTTSASAGFLIAVVRVDKDSTLIREDYSDGTSRFVILDNSEIAGEIYAGVKAKIDKYGINYSASADAGVALAGARVFEIDNPTDADAFEAAVQASGGFDGLLRDIASKDHKIPILGIDHPFARIDDAVLDWVGVDRDQDLPEPDETYVEAGVLLKGNAGAGAGGLPGLSAEIKGLIQAAGVAKVVTSGENKGDVEIALELSGDVNGALSQEMLGVSGGAGATGSFTATLMLDAQNGYEPDSLVITGTAGYTGTLDLGPDFNADDLAGLTDKLKTLSLTSSTGEGQGIKVGAELDLDDPTNRAAALDLLLSRGSAGAVAGLVDRLNRDGTLTLDTYDQTAESTDSEVKVGFGVGLGGGGGQSTDTTGGHDSLVRPPGESFQPVVCATPAGG